MRRRVSVRVKKVGAGVYESPAPPKQKALRKGFKNRGGGKKKVSKTKEQKLSQQG